MLAYLLLLQVTVSPPESFTFNVNEPIELRANIELKEGFKIAMRSWQVDKPANGREYEGGDLFAVWAPVGHYTIEMECLLINWDTRNFDKIKRVYNIHVQGGQPPPPNPIPPGPIPVTDPVKHLIILQNDMTTIKQAQELLILRSQVPTKYTLTIAHVEDLDSEDKISPIVQKYKNLVKEYPAVFFVTEDGRIVRQIIFQSSKELYEILRTNN